MRLHKPGNGHVALVALYVYDLLVAASCIKVLSETKQKLSTKFQMKDVRDSNFIVKIEFFPSRPQKKPINMPG